jgi:hypothetical protein
MAKTKGSKGKTAKTASSGLSRNERARRSTILKPAAGYLQLLTNIEACSWLLRTRNKFLSLRLAI